jgi:hypothetical protein
MSQLFIVFTLKTFGGDVLGELVHGEITDQVLGAAFEVHALRCRYLRALVSGEKSLLPLGKANVLHYRFADGGFVMVRPSAGRPEALGAC